MDAAHDLEALEKRVEAAAGPDRELDGLIFRAVFPEGDWHSFDGVWHRRDPEDRAAFDAPPAFTGSIDAAKTSVPTGMFEQIWSGTGTKKSSAQLIYPKQPGKRRPNSIYVVAETEPLALCAASLRALSQGVNDE